MRTQKRLEKISTAISLLALALGFSVLGLLIVAKEHEGATSIAGGILGIVLGATFLIAACLHWKCGDQIQAGFQVGEASADEIVSETRQAGNAICSF
jgi:peptidoglycan/LPS O-acetylase OafA/YrhL